MQFVRKSDGGWKVGRRFALGAALALGVMGAGSATAHAYPPNFPPGGSTSGALSVCEGVTPVLVFEVDDDVRIQLFDSEGNLLDEWVGLPPGGSMTYPGAMSPAEGGPDWPGVKFDGTAWVVDPTDAFLRDGVTVVFDGATQSATFAPYPTEAACAGPPTTGTGDSGGGRGVDDAGQERATPTGSLPATGSGFDLVSMSVIGILALCSGALVLIAGRRRSPAADAAS